MLPFDIVWCGWWPWDADASKPASRKGWAPANRKLESYGKMEIGRLSSTSIGLQQQLFRASGQVLGKHTSNHFKAIGVLGSARDLGAKLAGDVDDLSSRSSLSSPTKETELAWHCVQCIDRQDYCVRMSVRMPKASEHLSMHWRQCEAVHGAI